MTRHRPSSTTRARLVGLLTVLALVVLTWSGPTAEAGPDARPTPGAPGVGDPYFPDDGNGGTDVTHYDIHDAYDLRTGVLTGHTTVTLTATQDLSRFDLDLLLPAQRVTVDGRVAQHRTAGNHELVITPARPIATGDSVRVRVAYSGRPGPLRDLGAHWLADRHEVVAMNEPHMAAWWFPSNDHPRDKATYDISITGPKALEVIANGEPAGRTVRGEQATTTWRETQPMASYLAFFALGDFTVRHGVDRSVDTVAGGRPWWIAVSRRLPADVRRGDLRALRQSPAIVDWLEQQLGPYPFTSTGGLVTSLDPGFALENQTRPTYAAFDPANVTLLVHELTHQWFGDSVSVQDWRDIWVNEGFAQWMQTYWNETHGGTSAQTWLLDLYRRDSRVAGFWTTRVDDPGGRGLFGLPVYDRGAMAVQALRHRVGDPAFWTILRTWVAQRQYGNGSVADFEALASQVSGEDLSAFFRAWLHTRRAPARTAANGLR